MKKKRIQKCIGWSKKFVPFECRIVESFFTHISVIGRMKDKGKLPIHFDKKGSIIALVYLGSVNTGGSTQYFNGNTIKNVGEKYIKYYSDMYKYTLVVSIIHYNVQRHGQEIVDASISI